MGCASRQVACTARIASAAAIHRKWIGRKGTRSELFTVTTRRLRQSVATLQMAHRTDRLITSRRRRTAPELSPLRPAAGRRKVARPTSQSNKANVRRGFQTTESTAAPQLVVE